MQRRTFLATSAASAVLVMFRKQLSFAKDVAPAVKITDPLLLPFTGPYGGVPPFDRAKPALFKPAILKGMELHRAELAAIVANKSAPTFANTILAYEDSGRPFARANQMMQTFISAMNDKAMQAVETKMAPLLAAYSDEVIQNEELFKRIKTVWDARASLKLDPDQARLLDVHYKNFARRGAALGKTAKARAKEINGKLATLYTTFSQNTLYDEENQIVVLGSEADLAGLPDALKAAAKTAAEGKKLKDKWVIRNTRSATDPFLTYSTRRDLRQKVWKMFVGRGDAAGAHDNKPVITQILALRAERAKLLGFASHAHWNVDDSMAKKPEAAMALMMKVWPAAVARVKEEVADMQKLADSEKAGIKIEPWDYKFYAEKVRKAKYDLDENEIKGYLQLENLREALFWTAGKLFDLKFRQVKNVPVYMADVRCYEVTRANKRVGLWYFDPYARDGKRSGAWMSEYRSQETFKGAITPIVSNNSNYVKGKPGVTVLVSWDDAATMFHEFGHALHGLLSNIRYPTFAGTNTARDFVEFPSQLHEHWLPTKEVLDKFAIHYKTKKPMPADLVAKIAKAKNFNQGFITMEYMMSALYDMRIHMLGVPQSVRVDPGDFETRLFKEIGAPKEIVMRHRPTQFLHIFGDDGYSAGYYSYLWSDTLTADAGDAFKEAGGYYDKAIAKRYHDTILSAGNSIDPADSFRKFRGRDVDTNALMRSRGFPATK